MSCGVADARIGQVLAGRYRLERLLGSGGMGAVFAALDEREQVSVAIKVIEPRQGDDPTYVERLRREGAAMAAIDHPAIVRVRDVGDDAGRPFLVMELVDWPTLHELLTGPPLEPAHALAFTDQLLDGLTAAHARGIVHRDLKPTNIFAIQDADGPRVKIFDFGVMKQVAEGAQKHLTRTGMVLGTAEYMAPEQALGDPLDARTDLYAVGCVLFELLTGRPPFCGMPAMQIMTAHVIETPPPVARLQPALAGLDGVERLLARALAKQPAGRFPSAVEMRVAVRAAQRELVARTQVATRPAPSTPSGAETLPPRPRAGATPPPVEPRPGAVSVRGLVLSAMVGAAIAVAVGYLLFAR